MFRFKGYLWISLATCLVCLVLADERSPVLSNLSQGAFQFSLKIFDQVKEDGKNGIFSGYSLATLLSMTSIGAKGKTLKEIRLALGLPKSKKLVKQTYSRISRKLVSDTNVTLTIANGIFPKTDFQIRNFFTKVAKNHFKAEVTPLNYDDPNDAIQRLNLWVEEKTHKNINNLFTKDSVDSSTVCVFVNAIYFKGKWKQKFDAKLTEDRDFHSADGSTIKVPTMHAPDMSIATTYIESLKSEIILFPYEGERFGMYIILPDETFALSALEEKLHTELDPRILDSIGYESKRPVYLPKFKLKSTYDLKGSLKSIGINRIFDQRSDLSGIAGQRGELFVSEVIQKATIEISEEGSEAAAASGMVMMMRSMPLPPTPVIIDRPFVFLIRDQATGMILFSGRVLNPASSS